jgi:hypothetical protein
MTRTTILNALLLLAVAIESVYNLGDRIGTWYRNGGEQQIRKGIALTITAVVWTAETLTLGAQVLYRNRTAIMETAGRPFVYAA